MNAKKNKPEWREEQMEVIKKVRALIKRLSPETGTNSHSLISMFQDYYKALEDADEKVQLANQIYDLVSCVSTSQNTLQAHSLLVLLHFGVLRIKSLTVLKLSQVWFGFSDKYLHALSGGPTSAQTGPGTGQVQDGAGGGQCRHHRDPGET